MSSLKKLVATLVAIVHTRLQLFAVEMQAEGRRLAQMLMLAAAAMFFLACSVLLLTVFVIVMLWDTHRMLAIGGFAVLYLAIGAAFAVAARARAAAGSRLFEASLSELQKDRDRLSV